MGASKFTAHPSTSMFRTDSTRMPPRSRSIRNSYPDSCQLSGIISDLDENELNSTQDLQFMASSRRREQHLRAVSNKVDKLVCMRKFCRMASIRTDCQIFRGRTMRTLEQIEKDKMNHYHKVRMAAGKYQDREGRVRP